MNWEIVEERPRKFADESYYLKAACSCSEGSLVLEICWAQIMYSVTVELINERKESESLYDCMVFCEDRIEKYGHQIMRITDAAPFDRIHRLRSMQKVSVLNHYLSEKHNVVYKSELPAKRDA